MFIFFRSIETWPASPFLHHHDTSLIYPRLPLIWLHLRFPRCWEFTFWWMQHKNLQYFFLKSLKVDHRTLVGFSPKSSYPFCTTSKTIKQRLHQCILYFLIISIKNLKILWKITICKNFMKSSTIHSCFLEIIPSQFSYISQKINPRLLMQTVRVSY